MHTRLDAWQTAAVMTCLLATFGVLFGISALFVLRGLRAKIDAGEEPAVERALRLGRGLVLVGTAVGASAGLIGLVQFTVFASQLARMNESTLHRARFGVQP